MERAHSDQGVGVSGLDWLPRPRPKSLPPKRAITAIDDLRSLRPPIHFTPEDEKTLSYGIGLTQERCLLWLAILKQFFARQRVTLSETVPLKTLPPVSFLNLLIDWINVYARVTGRRKIKASSWRWSALRGFVHRHRRLQSSKLLRNISSLATSIAAHLDDPLMLLWIDYLQLSRLKTSSCNELGTTEGWPDSSRVFDVLKRVVVNKGKAVADDYPILKPYVSKEFREPTITKYLPVARELNLLEEFVARAAAMDVYLQYLRLGDRRFDQHYLEDVTSWVLKLGEPEARSHIQAIQRHFCARQTANPKRRPKKNVLRSKAG
jgi:hypothetical protein